MQSNKFFENYLYSKFTDLKNIFILIIIFCLTFSGFQLLTLNHKVFDYPVKFTSLVAKSFLKVVKMSNLGYCSCINQACHSIFDDDDDCGPCDHTEK